MPFWSAIMVIIMCEAETGLEPSIGKDMDMKAVLVIAHGSRVKETERTLVAVLNMVRERMPDLCIEHAFMEFSDQTPAKAVQSLVDQKVTEIKVVPYFLFTGVHLNEDIPAIIKGCMADHPNVRVIMGEPLGVDVRLADILVDRING